MKKRMIILLTTVISVLLIIVLLGGLGLLQENCFVSQDKASEGQGGPPTDADTSGITKKWLNVSYGTISDSQKLDIYLPDDGKGGFSVILQIHGGAFKSGDKASGELTPVLEALNRGYAVVAVNYRLSDEALFPAQINDVKAAIRFLRANADKYNLNPEKIATWGGSAGGNLSALAGTSGDIEEFQDETLGNLDQSDKVQAVVDWFGPIYFSRMDKEFEENGVTPISITNKAGSPESIYLGKTIGTNEAENLVKKASPETYISSDDPPFFIQHGTADKNIPVTQSIEFSEKLISVLGASKVTCYTLEGAEHGGGQFNSSENIDVVLDFLDENLK